MSRAGLPLAPPFRLLSWALPGSQEVRAQPEEQATATVLRGAVAAVRPDSSAGRPAPNGTTVRRGPAGFAAAQPLSDAPPDRGSRSVGPGTTRAATEPHAERRPASTRPPRGAR